MTYPAATAPLRTTPPAHDSERRLLDAAAGDYAAHLARLGPCPTVDGSDDLIRLVEASGLTGRGGAGFPSARKLAAVAAGRQPTVVANAAEGEPLSQKDRTLLTRCVHLVLDGLQLVGQATGSFEAYVYVPADLTSHVEQAVGERARVDPLAVRVVSAQDRFVAGEESAVVSRLAGGPALPMDTPRRIITAGLHGRPTLVHNVETLAHLALVARRGAGWFRSVGTPEETGTFLATVSGAIDRPGVYEAAYGIGIGELLRKAGGPSRAVQAVLVGGYHGAWLPWPTAAAVPMSRDGLRPFGAAPGAGVVAVLDARTCGVAQTAGIVAYLSDQSAGQCGPCLNGLPRLADALTTLADPRADRHGLRCAYDEVSRLCGLVYGRGACAHPDGTVRLVRSALTVFAEDLRQHLAGGCLSHDGHEGTAA